MKTCCHINTTHEVAVSNDTYWNEDMTECPKGVKLQLLGAGGIAMYGTYDGKNKFFIAWCPVPKRMKYKGE